MNPIAVFILTVIVMSAMTNTFYEGIILVVSVIAGIFVSRLYNDK